MLDSNVTYFFDLLTLRAFFPLVAGVRIPIRITALTYITSSVELALSATAEEHPITISIHRRHAALIGLLLGCWLILFARGEQKHHP